MWWRLAWVAAFALALAGGAWYVLADSDAAWWLGGLMGVPLIFLVIHRAEKMGDQPDTSTPPDGIWGPP